MNKTELETKNIIRLLEKSGVDVTEFKTEFDRIITRDHSSTGIQVADVMLKNSYITELNNLVVTLSEYLPYLELYQKVEYLEKGSALLKEKVELCKEIIIKVRSKDQKIMSNEKLLNRTYKVIFDCIKEEIKENFASEIFNHVMDDELDRLYLGEIIREEIDSLKRATYLENRECLEPLIKEEIKSNMASPSNYVTFPLIVKIVKCESKGELKEKSGKVLKETLDVFKSKLETLNDVLSHTNIKYAFLTPISSAIEDIESSKDDILRKIISGVLSASLLFGVGFGGTKLLKKWLTKDYYETTKITTVMDEEVQEPLVDTYYDTLIKEKDRLTLNVLGEPYLSISGDSYRRNCTKFYLENVIKQTDFEYLTIDLESPGLTYSDNGSKSYSFDEVETYRGDIRELIRITQETSPEYIRYSKGLHIFLCIVLYIGLIASSFIPYFPIKDIMDILEDLTYLNEDDNKYSSLTSELKELLNKCMKIIDENEELTEIYNQVISSGILDSDDEEIQKDIENLIKMNQNRKDLIMKSSKELSDLQSRYLTLKK